MIQRGDKVAYSRKFLQAIGCNTGWMPFARGEVTRIDGGNGWRLCHIKWSDGHESHVLDRNLVKQDRIHLEPV